MRIGIDAREIQSGVSTGIGRVLYNYLHYVSEAAHKDRFVLFSSQPLPFTFGSKFDNHVLSEDSSFLWEQIKIPLALANQRIEVYYSPYAKIPLWSSCKRVCSVLDLVHLKFEPYRYQLGLGDLAYNKIFGQRYLEKSTKILTCSHFTKQDIVDVYGIRSKKIEVIPLSISPAYRREHDFKKIEAVKNVFGIWGSYLLYVGNFKLHKNVPSLLHAFKELTARDNELKLVLVGPKTDSYNDLLKLIDGLGIRGRVIFTDRVVGEDKLRALYNGAEVFVMPSLYEGFGLPSLEAMACGTPVVCSNATSLPETMDDAALMVNARDPSEIARAIRTLLDDEMKRRQMVDKGIGRAVQFSGTAMIRKMFDTLKTLVE